MKSLQARTNTHNMWYGKEKQSVSHMYEDIVKCEMHTILFVGEKMFLHKCLAVWAIIARIQWQKSFANEYISYCGLYT